MDRDLALIDRLERLHPAVVADVLDGLGVRSQVLDPGIRPLSPGTKVAGFAATVRCVEVDAVPASRDDWYRGELAAVDALQPGDVMVVSTCRGSYWGELLATAARHRGARGIVADAYTRDTLALIEMGFPTFAAGIHCADSLGRIDVDAVGVPVDVRRRRSSTRRPRARRLRRRRRDPVEREPRRSSASPKRKSRARTSCAKAWPRACRSPRRSVRTA